MGVVSVDKFSPTSSKKWVKVAEDEWPSACNHARSQVEHTSMSTKPPPQDLFKWTWTIDPKASEASAALFMNVLSISAYAATARLGKPSSSPPALFYVAMPDPNRAVPLPNDSSTQDCRPDVLAFESSAFHPAPREDDPLPLQLWRLPNSPYEYIEKNLPGVLRFAPPEAHNKNTIREFESWFAEAASKRYLDLGRFCWPEVQLAIEAKLSNLNHAFVQELVYMRQQRRTQPWLRYVVGIVLTTKEMGLLRADPLGVEQTSFNKRSSRGVLEVVRICSGFARSTMFDRGQHAGFQLHDTTSLALPHLKPIDTDLFASGETNITYTHRTVRFIKLNGSHTHYPQNHTKDTTFFVHALLQDNGSLVGRCPRIFCVSREVGGGSMPRSFVGPYALKIYYADHQSECYKHDLIAVVREAQVRNVLVPSIEWRCGNVLAVRGFTADILKGYPEKQAVPGVISNREEVFALSDMKRVLAQATDFPEFTQAFVDFAEAIASLAENGLAHRDLSIGNVLLSQDVECAPAFFAEAACLVENLTRQPAVFSSRELDRRLGGVLHDLDMSGRLPHDQVNEASVPSESRFGINLFLAEASAVVPQAPQSPVPQKGFRTGTPPFMAINLLEYGPPNTAAHDLHSLLFVMCLFYWSFPTYVETPYPERVTLTARPWPSAILRWANRPGFFTTRELAGLKRIFFCHPAILRKIFEETLEGDLWLQDRRYLRLFWALYLVLWEPTKVVGEFHDRAIVEPQEVVAALRELNLYYTRNERGSLSRETNATP
ncbi:hypothetical protein B0H15DRAFT_4743 [Mycena belliarum]|uniref:Fungal-type protein kinase domain-containing protein n=1 Tax=Mycena belliarum TaxID=1033014 RepID=A0AAD6XUN5_9AGAR|nr:hypothetical protein B0H15DRAFT_4743 [Mycena belliae]